MSRYGTATTVRIEQRQRRDLRPVGNGWRFFPNSGPTADGPEFRSFLEALQWRELQSRRRAAKPLTAPICPPLYTRTGAPGELTLNEIPTIVYSADPPGPRGLIYSARRARITEMLTLHGFRNFRFHLGRTLRGPDGCDLPYCAAHCRDHAQFCRDNPPPLLLLEDDAEPAFLPTHFTPPPDADRLHIGGDCHGVDLARLLAWKQSRPWRRHKGYLWRAYNRDWFRQAGMLAYHAVLYLSDRIMAAIAEYLPRKTGAVDAVVSELDGSFNVYAPTRSWWWQNDGHNGAWSYDFVPPELRPRNYPPFPP